MSHIVHVCIFKRVWAENTLHGGGSISLRLGWGVCDVTIHRVGQKIYLGLVKVDEEVRGGRIGVIGVVEDFIQTLNFGHILIIVFPPDVSSEIVNVNPVVTK